MTYSGIGKTPESNYFSGKEFGSLKLVAKFINYHHRIDRLFMIQFFRVLGFAQQVIKSIELASCRRRVLSVRTKTLVQVFVTNLMTGLFMIRMRGPLECLQEAFGSN